MRCLIILNIDHSKILGNILLIIAFCIFWEKKWTKSDTIKLINNIVLKEFLWWFYYLLEGIIKFSLFYLSICLSAQAKLGGTWLCQLVTWIAIVCLFDLLMESVLVQLTAFRLLQKSVNSYITSNDPVYSIYRWRKEYLFRDFTCLNVR